MKRLINTDNRQLNLSKKYTQEMDMKPRGLWYSIDNEWLDWCKGNEFYTAKGLIEIEIDTTQIMVIQTRQQLDLFIDKFGYNLTSRVKYIDWQKLATVHSGVEFRDFYKIRSGFRSLLDLPTWYYALDCSSGCIWDLSIIKSQNYKDLPK